MPVEKFKNLPHHTGRTQIITHTKTNSTSGDCVKFTQEVCSCLGHQNNKDYIYTGWPLLSNVRHVPSTFDTKQVPTPTFDRF